MDQHNALYRDAAADYLALARLDGKVFAIAGAGGGIGRQTARALRQMGGRIVCIDQNESRGRAVSDEVDAGLIVADMTDDRAVEAALARIVDEEGRLDGIVDIVGASFGAGLLEADADLVKRNFDLNLHQAMSVTRHGANIMSKSGGGTIVLVGSVSGMSSLPNQIIYGSAKAALHHFVRCAAAEIGHLGVRINAVAPGYVRTERMIERFPAESWDEIAANTPLQRGGETPDVAGPILFLSQNLSSFVTGQVLVVDGGLTSPIRALRDSSARQIAGRA